MESANDWLLHKAKIDDFVHWAKKMNWNLPGELDNLGPPVEESPVQRRERLKTRVNQEKAKGTRAFLKVVAQEEGISVTRLKQLLQDKPNS